MSRRHRARSDCARRRTAAGCLAAVLGPAMLTVACSAAGPVQAHPASPAAAGRTASSVPGRRPAKPQIGVIGNYAVGGRTIRLVEAAHAGPGGARIGRRVLRTLIWYPEARTGAAAGASGGAAPAAPAAARPASGPFPLIAFAPGYLQCGGVYRQLLRTWASAGYVVAVLTFPRTNCDLGAAADEADLVNQPADVSWLISQLISDSARRRGWLSGLINQARIAVAGHSDGGDTVAAVAADTCCQDHRVTGAIVLAGAEWPPLRGRYFPPGSPPMLFVQGSADPINPPGASLQLYQADTAGPRYYLDVFGAGHLTPYEGDTAQERLVARVTIKFLDRFIAGQHGPRSAMARMANGSGQAALVSGGRLPPA
jgi:dienelactone hydrolase